MAKSKAGGGKREAPASSRVQAEKLGERLGRGCRKGMAGEWPRCTSLARASWCRDSFGDGMGWEVWGPRHRPLGKPSLHVRFRGKKPGRCGGSMRVRGGGVSRALDRCTSRAAAEGRWGKQGELLGWAGATPRGKGWRCGLLPSLFAAGLRRTPLVAHFASSSVGRAGAGREWPRTPRPL